MKNFYLHEWSMAEKKLMVLIAFLSGIIIGFVFSPIKKGVYCGNNNGNTSLAHDK